MTTTTPLRLLAVYGSPFITLWVVQQRYCQWRRQTEQGGPALPLISSDKTYAQVYIALNVPIWSVDSQ